MTLPETCEDVQETNTQTCEDGVWSDWTGGNGLYEACVEVRRCENPETEHNASVSRSRYADASVLSPDVCEEGLQTNVCSDGIWRGWSQDYIHEDCYAYGTFNPFRPT